MTEDKIGIFIALFIIAGLGLIGWLIICIAKTVYKRLHKSQDESTTNDAILRMEKLRKFTFVVLKLIVLLLIYFGNLGISESTVKAIGTAITIATACVAVINLRNDEETPSKENTGLEEMKHQNLELQRQVAELQQQFTEMKQSQNTSKISTRKKNRKRKR